jgi:hypothetical protein
MFCSSFTQKVAGKSLRKNLKSQIPHTHYRGLGLGIKGLEFKVYGLGFSSQKSDTTYPSHRVCTFASYKHTIEENLKNI